MCDLTPANDRGGLHFLDDAWTTWGSRHQEGKQALRTRKCRFGEQKTGGLLFSMRIRDVEPHATCAGSAHFEVGLRAGAPHRLVQELNMSDELRNVERCQEDL